MAYGALRLAEPVAIGRIAVADEALHAGRTALSGPVGGVLTSSLSRGGTPILLVDRQTLQPEGTLDVESAINCRAPCAQTIKGSVRAERGPRSAGPERRERNARR
jgi:hypothetical protein